jgi:hypothetical protein
MGGLAGCVDRTPPPPDAAVPPRHGAGIRGDEAQKPLPGEGPDEQALAQGQGELPPPPFNDVPLVAQDTPEQRAFVDAYTHVGRPRIVVFVNRTLEGDLLPTNDAAARSSGASGQNRHEVTIENRDRRETVGRGGEAYLQPGQYNASDARQIDYEAIETVLTDWLAAGGKVAIVSPVTARQRMSADQQRDVETGQARAMSALGRSLDADVLVQVNARPTHQTPRGLEVRMVAEAINVQGGQSIGRAVVDMPPPLDKPRINKFTRFLARVLMDRMIGTWENMPPAAENAERTGARESADPNRPAAPAADVPAVPAPGSAAPSTTSPTSPTPPTDQAAPPAAPRTGPRIENVPPPEPSATEPSAEPSR